MGLAADAEQAGESASDERRAQTKRIALRLVGRNHGLAIAIDRKTFLILYFPAAQQNCD